MIAIAPALFVSWHPDPAGTILGSRYQQFVSRMGIHGLAKKEGTRIDLLMVMADEPGTGQFRSFITALKEQFATICVWQIFNPFLGLVLVRYGFLPEVEIQGDGEILEGYRWDKL